MKLRGLLCIAALLLAAAACLFFSVPGEVTGERTAVNNTVQQKAVQGEKSVAKIYPENNSDRTYSIALSAWDSGAYSEPVNVIVCVETTQKMLWLADSPVNNDCYYKNKAYETLEAAALYTIDQGAYKQVLPQGEDWVIEGTGKAVGKTARDGSVTFTKDVYAKGQSRTRLERLQEALKDFIGKLAGINPQNRVGLVLYGGVEKTVAPISLNEEGARALLAQVDALTAGGEQEAPLFPTEEAAALLSGDMSNAAVNLACSRFKGETSALLSLYCVTDLENKAMLSSYSFVPPDRLFTAEPGQALNSILTSLINGSATRVTHVLDPRFELTEACAARLQDDPSASVNQENGGTVIAFDAILPVDPRVKWERTLEVRAKADFIGGNRIPTGRTDIARGDTRIYSFGDSLVNVPVQFHVAQTGAGIFSGETVPVLFGGTGVAEAMCSVEKYNFYGMGETGKLTYRWLDENGSDLGSTEEVGRLRPASSRALTLAVTFVPAADGSDLPPAAGKPAVSTTLNGSYRVKVTTGTITAYVKAPPDENQVFTLTLEGNGETRRASVMTDGAGKTEEGLVTLSAEFKELPQGKYTLSCTGPGTLTAAPGENCTIYSGQAVITLGNKVEAQVSRASAVFTEKEAAACAEAVDIQRFEFAAADPGSAE